MFIYLSGNETYQVSVEISLVRNIRKAVKQHCTNGTENRIASEKSFPAPAEQSAPGE